MARGLVALASLALTVVMACSPWRPPPPDLLDGWREVPPTIEGTEEWVQGQSVMQIPPVFPLAPNDFATRFDDPGTTTGHLQEHFGADVTNVDVGAIRHHADVMWVDVAFDVGGARRKIRIAWFAVEEGTQVFRLIAPAARWNSRELSSFQELVRHRARQARLAD